MTQAAGFLKRYPRNKKGRDFVIGDLHGCYDYLQRLLDYVEFDEGKDRLFSVGDLVDRGSRNEDCLRLLYEPWFHPVQGNHEQLMHGFFNASPIANWWPPNGGDWGVKYHGDVSDDAKEMQALVKQVHKLPLMVTVELPDDRRFHVIHAELYSEKELSDESFEDMSEFWDAALYQSRDGDFITWGRRIFYSLAFKGVLSDRDLRKYQHQAQINKFDRMFGADLSPIYSGHTPVQVPMRYKAQTNIDTGAFLAHRGESDFGLTMTEPLTDRFWTAKVDDVYEVQPQVLA